MFIDRVRLKLVAGTGGNGKKSFNIDRKPDGGDGGKGGDIYVIGSTHTKDLRGFTYGSRVHKAGTGEAGGKQRKTGSGGKDLIIELPVNTHVLDDDTGQTLAIISDTKTKHLIVNGGKGGSGNYHFRTGIGYQKEKTIPGYGGEERNVVFEIRLTADVVFIGFPNAGKSSMLNALTNADVKVAPYAFTTLTPHIGTVGELKLMDLPGLIEGTVEGKGLGTRFTKHAEQGKLVAHFVSLENDDVVSSYNAMRKEIESISGIVTNLPEVVLLTKSDLFDSEYIKKKQADFEAVSINAFVTSAYKYDLVQETYERFKENLRAKQNQ